MRKSEGVEVSPFLAPRSRELRLQARARSLLVLTCTHPQPQRGPVRRALASAAPGASCSLAASSSLRMQTQLLPKPWNQCSWPTRRNDWRSARCFKLKVHQMFGVPGFAIIKLHYRSFNLAWTENRMF